METWKDAAAQHYSFILNYSDPAFLNHFQTTFNVFLALTFNIVETQKP